MSLGLRGGGSEPERCVRDDVQCPWGDTCTQECVAVRRDEDRGQSPGRAGWSLLTRKREKVPHRRLESSDP